MNNTTPNNFFLSGSGTAEFSKNDQILLWFSTGLLIIKLIYQVYEGLKSNTNYRHLNEANLKVINKLQKVGKSLKNYLRCIIENSKPPSKANIENIFSLDKNDNKNDDKNVEQKM